MTSRSFRMWINDFSKNNKEDISAMPKVEDKDFKRGDKVSTPYGDGMFVSYSEDTDECTIQMYSDNRSVRLYVAVVRKI